MNDELTEETWARLVERITKDGDRTGRELAVGPGVTIVALERGELVCRYTGHKANEVMGRDPYYEQVSDEQRAAFDALYPPPTVELDPGVVWAELLASYGNVGDARRFVEQLRTTARLERP